MSGRAAGAPVRALYGVPAPAKLNWFLHVLGRRDDGMHRLQTVFQFIDWCDLLDFELNSEGRIEREGGDGLPDEDLCVRAARLLQRHAGCRLGVRMRLRKRVPAQAGLGGGSSDAASVLLALNRLWGLRLRRGELQALAARLGADVPVFVFGRNAFAEGIGEQLREVDLPRWRALVAWPGAGLSTAQVFASPVLTRNTPACTMEGFCEHLKRGLAAGCETGCDETGCDETGCSETGRDSGLPQASARMRELLAFGANDLQAVAVELLPRMRDLQRWLASRGDGPARMSGSGSAMFAPWPGGEQGSADSLAASVPDGWSARVCSTLPRHPLQHWAED